MLCGTCRSNPLHLHFIIILLSLLLAINCDLCWSQSECRKKRSDFDPKCNIFTFHDFFIPREISKKYLGGGANSRVQWINRYAALEKEVGKEHTIRIETKAHNTSQRRCREAGMCPPIAQNRAVGFLPQNPWVIHQSIPPNKSSNRQRHFSRVAAHSEAGHEWREKMRQ